MLQIHMVILHKALLCLFSVTRISEERIMNYVEEILQAIFIGLAVANFLLNIGRASKAIQFCKECLVLLNEKALCIEKQLRQFIYKKIYGTMFKVHRRVSDHTNALACGRKLLAIHQECSDTVQEGKLSLVLAQIYQSQSMYAEAKEHYERAIPLMRTIGNRRDEAKTYGRLGCVFYSLGEYVKAKEYHEKVLTIATEIGDRTGQATQYGNLGTVFKSLGEYVKAKEYHEKALAIIIEIDDREKEAAIYGNLGTVFQSLGEYVKAKEYHEKALAISIEIGYREGQAAQYGNLGAVLKSLGEYVKAKEYHEKALAITIEIGHREGEAAQYGNLGAVFRSLGEYVKAKEYHEKALAISIEIGHREGEAAQYGNLGAVFRYLGEYVKAKGYHEKALAISIQIDDRAKEAAIYGSLGVVFQSLGEYVKAKEYHEKALAISIEIDYRAEEAAQYGNLGAVFQSLAEYVKAIEYHEKALAIRIEIDHREGEATQYGNLGALFGSLGEYVKAIEYHEKALAICIEIGHRKGEAAQYGNLGAVFQSLGEYVKAKEYVEKALTINTEIGDRTGQATQYGNLGAVFQSLGEYVKAKEYHEKALTINTEIGDRTRQATQYGNLGALFGSLGEYVKAKEYHEKALTINTEIGDRTGQATQYANLGAVFHSLDEYVKAKEYYEKALAISIETGDRQKEIVSCRSLGLMLGTLGEYAEAAEYYKKASAIRIRMEKCGRQQEADEYIDFGNISRWFGKYPDAMRYYEKALAIEKNIGDRMGEAACHKHIGTVFESIYNTVKAIECHKKALAIATETGDRQLEGICYERLGRVYRSRGEYVMAEEHLKKALSISKDIGDGETEFHCYLFLALTKLSEKKVQEAFSYLKQSTGKFEQLRGLLGDSDRFKISFAHKNALPYQQLSSLLCDVGNPREALYASELGRARALADLMATQYSAEPTISADPQSWTGIENVIRQESNHVCLYISYSRQTVFLWILKKSGAVCLRNFKVDKKTLHTRLGKVARHLDEFFAIMAESFRTFGILPEELCEDRSFPDIESKLDSSREENFATLRQGKGTNDPAPSLTLFYEILINPVCDLLDEPEIIIVPDRGLYRVPFPALLDGNGKYLTETFRIRVVPSLTTLKLIQDSPADYHSQTGALVVGDPDVGKMIYRGRLNEKFVPLPGARKEAEMIARLLGVRPLLGQHATKQAVLERIKSVSLIHIAAHGNAERGEIALAPLGSTTGIPQEDDYLLKMSDISQVQVRAKLVVLSCCHSGRGQIKAEGVVGIARAFLGSGARSVLVALWALEDRATEQLMSRFYENLVRGISASESLHEAIKWMRDNGCTKVSEWAPFMLIGDNVTFAFGKQR